MTLDPNYCQQCGELGHSGCYESGYSAAQQEIAALKAELTQAREERSAAIKELGEYARTCGHLTAEVDALKAELHYAAAALEKQGLTLAASQARLAALPTPPQAKEADQ